jgi:hypothetical protein
LIEIINSDEGWNFIVMPAWMWNLDRFLKVWQVDDYFAIIIQSLEVSESFFKKLLKPPIHL